jgi:hypothetical protein
MQTQELETYLQFKKMDSPKFDEKTLLSMANNKSIQIIKLMDNGVPFGKIPEHLINDNICQYAFEKNPKIFDMIPNEFITKEMCISEISIDKWQYMMPKFKYDEDVILALIDQCQKDDKDDIVNLILIIEDKYLTAKIIKKLSEYKYSDSKISYSNMVYKYNM